MQETGSDVKRALELVRARQGQGVVLRATADDMGVAESTVSRWLAGERSPTGDGRVRLLAWADRQGRAPLSADQQYWRGVLYACEAMAETTARLLREAREADERPRDHSHHPEAKAVSRSVKSATAPEARARRQK